LLDGELVQTELISGLLETHGVLCGTLKDSSSYIEVLTT